MTTGKGVSLSTCSENCAANVAAALLELEVCTVDSVLFERTFTAFMRVVDQVFTDKMLLFQFCLYVLFSRTFTFLLLFLYIKAEILTRSLYENTITELKM